MIQDAINGMPVVLVDPVVLRVCRTWRQRLTSRPWRPWRAWRAWRLVTIEPQFPPGTPIPAGMAIVVGGAIFCRTADWATAKARMAELKRAAERSAMADSN